VSKTRKIKEAKLDNTSLSEQRLKELGIPTGSYQVRLLAEILVKLDLIADR
jgi:hypothetical protein